MLKNLIMVALGGGLGSVIRFGFSQWFRFSAFPLATFLVNIIGSFLIGMVLAISLRDENFEQNWRLFLATGFCGGFTTFSAFSLEGMALLQEQKFLLYAAYVIVSVILGLAASWLGYMLLK